MRFRNGLVDHIVAGHVHQGIAHDVNGIAVTASYSNTRAFSRVDFTVDRRSGEIVERRVYPPQEICGEETEGPCEYEGRPVVPMPEVVAIAERAQGVAARRKAEKLGVYLETSMTLRKPGPSRYLAT